MGLKAEVRDQRKKAIDRKNNNPKSKKQEGGLRLIIEANTRGGEVTKARFAQYFHGSLASLTIRPGKIESQKVISCLQACKEGLDINSLESLGQGIKYHFNPSQSVLVIEGDDIENINQALRKVSYINSRQFPTSGIRRLKVSSRVQCFGEDVCISIPDIDAYVMVFQAKEPKITISGMDHFARPAAEFEHEKGVTLLPDIRIVSSVTKMEHPPYLKETTNRGVDTMKNYEHVLQHVHYRNWHTSSIFDRKFRIKCSELNGRYTSNEFNLEVNILHNSNTNIMEYVNHMKYEEPHNVEEESDEEEDELEDDEEDTSADSDESEEEEEEEEETTIGNKEVKRNVIRQDQLEWDDSTVPY
ncbi:hypothetical protein JD844_007262 [Phrynosoma platyrhinos]|uniref:Calsyntenin C-terminal domain-containing protein n=1 Tax=Phrynosoma platyrhinos TaxID=52577 RepID=A0ABQ7T3C9_PHRPL|nr:hypothetical protein JD844_007262 [Phrynosoma platyrhinos]